MPIDRIVYEKNSLNKNWNFCFGYEPQEYFETMLPNTLVKVWQTDPKGQKYLWLNRYLSNNTLTNKLGLCCMGDGDEDHQLIFRGVPVDRTSSVETLNGYIHRIKDILKYDQHAKDALHERPLAVACGRAVEEEHTLEPGIAADGVADRFLQKPRLAHIAAHDFPDEAGQLGHCKLLPCA
jgi:hypothetical protein